MAGLDPVRVFEVSRGKKIGEKYCTSFFPLQHPRQIFTGYSPAVGTGIGLAFLTLNLPTHDCSPPTTAF